jgi:hypothetical protein
MELVDGDTVTVVRDTLDALLVYHVRCSAFCSYVLLCLYQCYSHLFPLVGALIVSSPCMSRSFIARSFSP